MAKPIAPHPNQTANGPETAPFSELLAREDVVYHGIGTDIVALAGIAEHGIVPVATQEKVTGLVNSNGPRELSKNGDDSVSVVKTPRPGESNQAFTTYIEHSPISFAIHASGNAVSQPPNRGFYDEAFILGAKDEDIVGVVIDGVTADMPVSSLPIVTGNVAPDAVAGKARNIVDFIAANLDPAIASHGAELDSLLEGIAHITADYLRPTFGEAPEADRSKIEGLDQWLRDQLSAGLIKKFGKDLSVFDLVSTYFPSKPLYINNHDTGIEPYSEKAFFDTLPSDAKIGYEAFDGSDDGPSLQQLRQAIGTSALDERGNRDS
jgi:hypothetical protein